MGASSGSRASHGAAKASPPSGFDPPREEMAAKCDWCEGYFSDVVREGEALLCSMCREPARTPISRVGEMNRDVMDCGDPETSLHETIRHFRWRAQCEASIARELRQTAAAAKSDADEHSERAEGFLQIASAMEKLPVTFPASGIEAPSGGETSTEIEGSTEGESPTAEGGDAQKESPND